MFKPIYFKKSNVYLYLEEKSGMLSIYDTN